MKKQTKYGLKGFQLKHIIEQYNEKQSNPEKIIKGYKSMTIDKLEHTITMNAINITKYKIIEKNPYSTPQDIYKKAGIVKYNNENQENYTNELTKNERYSNPLIALNQYTNKEGKKEYLTPQKHQEIFIKQFIYSQLNGAVVFHGVGSGKTLTAVISSYYYLKIYPKNRVIVISPSSLLFNFVAGMKQYGLDINDNRYNFYTYEKYVRNPMNGKDALLIVDEAHNLRTFMGVEQLTDPTTGKVTNIYESIANKRGLKIWNYGALYAHKILLLTGTAFVNRLYDIENLLAMVDQREPLHPERYDSIVESVENIKDYFDYKISYFKSEDKEGFFPERKDFFTPIEMTEEEKQLYLKIKSEGVPITKKTKNTENSSDNNPNAFYIAERYASNMIGNRKNTNEKNNPKIKKIVELIKANPKQKFIIYCALTEYGLNAIEETIKGLGFSPVRISGRESTLQKEQSKFYFNYYNFHKENFFDLSTVPTEYHKYINSKHNVLLISRAGAEGVDTINCNNIILYESQWNDALSEQIIARAIRFKSHLALPKKERYVNVYRLIYCFKENMELANKIKTNEDKINYNELKSQLKGDMREQLDDIEKFNGRYIPKKYEVEELEYQDEKGETKKYVLDKNIRNEKGEILVQGWEYYDSLKLPHQRGMFLTTKYNQWYKLYGTINSKRSSDGRYVPTKEELEKLTYKNHEGKTIKFIPDQTIRKHIKGRYGRPSQDILIQKGWDSYYGNEKQLENWRIEQWYKYQNTHNKKKIDTIDINSLSVDLWLYILAKAKQATIDGFIKHFGGSIKLYESYESMIMKLIKENEKRLNRVLTESEKIELYNKEKNNEVKEILKYNIPEKISKKRNKKNQLQQFYTNEILATYIYEFSSLKTNKNTNIKVLEPSAGVGDLVKPIVKNNKNVNITMVEIDPENQTILKQMIKEYPLLLNLSNQNNFLLYQTSERFDYIFMNPPFHLRKEDDRNLKRDVYDTDFIKKAFALLKIGGEIMAITGHSWKKDNTFKEWTKLKDKEFAIEEKVKEKFSGIKIDISVMKIKKLSTEHDDDILSEKYYKVGDFGDKVIDNTVNIEKVFKSPKDKADMKKENKAFELAELEELKALEEELENILNNTKPTKTSKRPVQPTLS